MIKNIFYKDCCDKFVDYVKKSHITTQNEPKSEKATQDVQKNCLSLTEQWKNGELETGWYYLKTEKETSIGLYAESFGGKYWAVTPQENISKILAEVPSYNEWQQMKAFCEEFNALKVAEENEQLKLIIKRTKASGNYPSRVSQYKARITVLTEENQKLKECLKNCRELFDTWDYPNIVKEIDEVLNDKERG